MLGLKGHFEKVDINYRHSHAEAAEDGGTRALNRGGWLGGNNAATVRPFWGCITMYMCVLREREKKKAGASVCVCIFISK